MACKARWTTCVRSDRRRPGIIPDAAGARVVSMIGILVTAVVLAGFPWQVATAQRPGEPFTFALVSDLHYGLTRPRFLGDSAVPAWRVNAALADVLRALPIRTLPDDGGVQAGAVVGDLAFVAVTGDIANRAEGGVQPAAVSWREFLTTFVQPLSRDRRAPLPVFAAAGNHDASNAIGYVPALAPSVDTTAMSGLYRRAERQDEQALLTAEHDPLRQPFDYARDRVHYVRWVGGVAIMVLHIWPDAGEREWMERELAMIPDTVPVLLFAHDPPLVDPRHFTAPDGGPPGTGGFQGLLTERWRGEPLPAARLEGSRTLEEFRALLRRHRNIRAYFHGHENWTEYHALRDADGTPLLPAFRVDSPLKGRDSAGDDAKLAFLLVSIDADRRHLTVREYRWALPPDMSPWGAEISIPLR